MMKRGLIIPAVAAGLLLPAAPAIIKPASAWAAHEKMLLANFLPGMMPGWNRDGGFLPVNLFTKTEQFDNAAWSKTAITVTANTTVAPDGATTAETLTITSGLHNIRQDVTVLASTQYTFSFYALRGTATDLRYAVYNMNALSFIVGGTSYYALTNGSTWSRISVTFTTPSGCTTIRPWMLRDSGVASGTVFLWGAQLEIGGTMNTYVPVG